MNELASFIVKNWWQIIVLWLVGSYILTLIRLYFWSLIVRLPGINNLLRKIVDSVTR